MTEYFTIESEARDGTADNAEELLQAHIDRLGLTDFVFNNWYKNVFTYYSEQGDWCMIVILPDYCDILSDTMKIQQFCQLDADEVYYFLTNGETNEEKTNH